MCARTSSGSAKLNEDDSGVLVSESESMQLEKIPLAGKNWRGYIGRSDTFIGFGKVVLGLTQRAMSQLCHQLHDTVHEVFGLVGTSIPLVCVMMVMYDLSEPVPLIP